MPSQASVRSCSGSSSSDWSRASKITFSTQMVMTSGIQISRPAMKYFFTVLETKKPGGGRAGRVLRHASGRGLGFRILFRIRLRLGLGFGLRLGLGGRLARRLEV